MAKVFALVAAVAAAVSLVGTALAGHSWFKYHWARTSNPFTVQLGNNVNSTWYSHLEAASSDWTPSSVLDTTVVSGQGGTNCSPTSGRIEVCNSNYGNTGWLGIARIWIWGTHIVQGVVQVNDYYHDNPPYNTGAWRQYVMCQEVGHTFGLDHQDETFDNPNLGSCMDYTNDPDGGTGGASSTDPSNERPNKHDFDQLDQIYKHRDRSTTLAASSAGLPGRAPSFSQASRANGSLYVDELENGQRLVTWVLWTPLGD